MVNYQILNKLLPITREERELLAGDNQINRKLYMPENQDRISNCLLLENGKRIAVRPHTRFVDFPEHDHDYIEVVYMCSGSTTHLVNGQELHLEEGGTALFEPSCPSRHPLCRRGGCSGELHCSA